MYCRRTKRNISDQIARSGDERADHKVIAPPRSVIYICCNTIRHYFTCSVPYDFLSFEGGARGLCHASLFYKTHKKHTKLLLSEYEGRGRGILSRGLGKRVPFSSGTFVRSPKTASTERVKRLALEPIP